MRLLAIALLGCLAGCASSMQIRAGADAHQHKAEYLEAHGDYYGAAKERAAADNQRIKANKRAWNEQHGYWF
jgi:hypothetical protein